MTSSQAEAGKARFLIHASDDDNAAGAPLSEFLSNAASDPDIAVVDTIGPSGRPHTAVVEISPEKARALAQRFRSNGDLRLTIEPDRPLSLFD